MTTVLICDDHRIVREGLRTFVAGVPGVDRVETATTLQIRQVRRKWAGLRSFVADKNPVVGFAPGAPGFLAGRAFQP